MDNLLEGRRILVVEDEMMILMMIEDMLADLGCADIVAAATIEQGMLRIEGDRFDAAMLDINLNGDESYPLAEALDARATPFMFCTGTSLRDMRGEYRGRAFLRKPFRTNHLRLRMQALLEI
jgi:DNA-binding response OmpR family regulator